ncbi:4-hydroxyphenylpyruvate dioxygenase [Streptomyces platensis]|uniref:4-hydroxyphenylpyruvate dioxygenase n=1 Tax=Streptomyces platensis TaxID=58346 RepID=UPI002E25BD99|nr:4-hydroxyphenylpyruvate dioxygenase [Streptomyces platensis]WUB77742.1 4-hydroxyphenylpyruvate dioxygenase [Streptomyces platensis]WUB84579.1 4-hydroxyphenylpyruvate dioxygenase [Streptomyces platensis]
MQLFHVEFYVRDVDAYAADLERSYGFRRIVDPQEASDSRARSTVLQRGSAVILVTQGLDETHPAAVFVTAHGDGVGDIALGVDDARAAYDRAVSAGVRGIQQPTELPDGTITAVIEGFGDVTHTFVQSPLPGTPWALPGFPVEEDRRREATRVGAADIIEIDHFAVCLEADMVQPTVDFYRTAVGFDEIFEERIVVGDQAMISKVVQSPSGTVTLTLIEPDVTRELGQIDRFLKDHGGPGVQHIAFRVADAVRSVGQAMDNGVEFLTTPAAYYRLMEQRLRLSVHTVGELERLGILVDEDHDGQLFQIFTRSNHDRCTLFFEIIERVGAKTFGSGNIKALYEAVEAEKADSRTAGS